MTRALRRFRRETAIARRVYIIRHIWHRSSGNGMLEEPGRYAKFNLNCGCRMCHYYKYEKPKRKRRNALKAATIGGFLKIPKH